MSKLSDASNRNRRWPLHIGGQQTKGEIGLALRQAQAAKAAKEAKEAQEAKALCRLCL